MWVKIIKNYPGVKKPLKGMEGYSYQQNQRLDISDEIAKKLISNHYAEKSCPPWEDHIDKKAAELNKLKAAVAGIENQLRDNRAELKKMQAVADDIPRIKRIIEALEQNHDNAEKQLKDFAAKNNIDLKEKADGKEKS